MIGGGGEMRVVGVRITPVINHSLRELVYSNLLKSLGQVEET